MVRHPSTGQNPLMVGDDLLNKDTDTVVSQLSETEQGIMCVKEGIGKYDMWYGVVVVYYESIKREVKIRGIYVRL